MADQFPESWEEMLKSILGKEGAERAIESMRSAGLDPATMGEAAGMPSDPAQLQQIVNQVRAMLASSGDGPVNWTLAHDVARQQVHTMTDPVPTAAQDARYRGYLQAADLWLDSATDLVGAVSRRGTMSRAQWVGDVLPTFQSIAEPVAENVVRAVTEMLTSQLSDMTENLPEIPGLGLAGPQASDMLKRMGGATFGMQLGAAVATLAKDSYGLTDLGIPLTDPPAVALMPTSVDAFADGLEIPVEEVAQFLAVREVAHARLYTASPWLRSRVVGLVQAYAREIRIDTEAMEEAIRSIDPTNPEELRNALGSGIFAPAVSEQQKHTLESLETTLAVIEGWVEHVTTQATLGVLPNSVALTEMMRRRRATGGPAEETFRNLIGLELRPRRCREATTLWETLTRELGMAERDALWAHPDLMPSTAELDDPGSLVTSRAAGVSDLDDVLESILSGADAGSGEGAPDGGEPTDSGTGTVTPDDGETTQEMDAISDEDGAAEDEGTAGV